MIRNPAVRAILIQPQTETGHSVAKILAIEDDIELSNKIREWLELEHHSVEVCNDGSAGCDFALRYSYDLLVLDWQLPGLSGIEICRSVRSSGNKVPILMLTGMSTISDKETGLDSGADDYLTKPFNPRELCARVRAMIRRSSFSTDNTLSLGPLSLDPQAYRVTINGEPLQLLPKEIALLEYLLRHPNQIFSGDVLLEKVWSSDSEASANTVRTYLYTLRKKIAAKGYQLPLQTVYGVGYKMETT